MKNAFETIEDCFHFLFESRPHQQIKLGLERIFMLSRKMGNPEKSFRSVHIAGTNGKGSVTKMISAFLTQMGYRTGANYSPHLVSFHERITLNDQLITDGQLLRVLNHVYPVIAQMDEMQEKMKPTYFEIVTEMAFQFFKEENVDFAAIEVGMGGRLDASNILNPEVCIITSIGFDHMKSLGNTLGKIAGEKAGIIKRGKPIVCGVLQQALGSVSGEEARLAIAKRAEYMQAAAYFVDRDFSFKPLQQSLDHNRFSYYEKDYALENLTVRLNGSHQFNNASTAICAFRRLCERTHIPYREEVVRKTLEEITWPGRFEIISHDPIIVIDGGHNPPAFEALVRAWKEYFGQQKAVFLTGILADKDYTKMAEIIAPIVSDVVITEPKAPERVQIGVVVDAFKAHIPENKVELIVNHEKACEKALRIADQKSPILVAGSLYLVGYIKDIFNSMLSSRNQAG